WHCAALVLLNCGSRAGGSRSRDLRQGRCRSPSRTDPHAHAAPGSTGYRHGEGAPLMSERTGTASRSDWLIGAIKQNPEGLLLLAAGAVLLMRRGSTVGPAMDQQR